MLFFILIFNLDVLKLINNGTSYVYAEVFTVIHPMQLLVPLHLVHVTWIPYIPTLILNNVFIKTKGGPVKKPRVTSKIDV